MNTVALLFWVLVAMLGYAYVGYPVLLCIIKTLRKVRVKQGAVTPQVSLIIAAYNEEIVIREKIKNTLLLDYPKEHLEIIVVSDCSTDNTDAIVKEYENQGVKLLRIPERGGKVAGHREAVKIAGGDILVFSDATGMYESDAVKKLVRNFADEKVGCVGGMLKYINSADSTLGSGEGLYWRYEVFLRKMESNLGSLAAVSGSIYAVRKGLYFDFPEKLADDLVIPLFSRQKGYYVVYEPEAVCVEETVTDNAQELAKRARIANQNIRGILYMKHMLNFFRYPVTSLVLFSHKLLRQLVPLILLILLGVNGLLSAFRYEYMFLFLCQICFYAAALAGYRLDRKKQKNKLLFIPYYFCTTNVGILFGFLKLMRGRDERVWEPVR